MEETVPVWYVLAGDHIRLDSKEVEVLDKSLFRDGGQNFRIAGFEQDEEVVEVTYYIGIGDLVNSFHLSLDDTLRGAGMNCYPANLRPTATTN